MGHGSGGGFGVVGQVVGLGLWCGDWWVSLDYLMVVLLGLGVVCSFVGGSVDGSDDDFFFLNGFAWICGVLVWFGLN